MKADLTAAERRERILRYASYGLMVLSPFLLLGILSLILGRSALDALTSDDSTVMDGTQDGDTDI